MGKTSYNDFVLARGEFLRLVGAPNESLRLIIIYYMFKPVREQKNFGRAAWEPKKHFNGSI